jgi:uncharacterized Tic20 family protein
MTDMSSEEQRTWAIAAHAIAGAAMILSAGTLGFVAALVIYLVHKDRGAFVRQYSANAVNIQLNALMWAIVGFVLAIVLVGFLVLAVVPVWATVLHIIAAIKASQGEAHWSPMTIRVVR